MHVYLIYFAVKLHLTGRKRVKGQGQVQPVGEDDPAVRSSNGKEAGRLMLVPFTFKTFH